MKTTLTSQKPKNGLLASVMAGLSAFALIACLCFTGSSATAQEGEQIDRTRDAFERYVETRRLISKEKSDWQLGQTILMDRIEVTKREIEAWKEQIAEAKANITSTDQKMTELVAENEALKKGSSALAETISKLEARTKGLLERLPAPIADQVEPLAQRLPEDPETTKEGLGRRFESVVGILNLVTKFHRSINKDSELLELQNGVSAEVATFYLGISQGFYVTADNTKAGVGRGTEAGWVWEPANASALSVRKALEIIDGQTSAEFVGLPIEVQ